jgi:hypothetical protein
MNKRILELALQAKLGPALLLHHWGNVDALTDCEQGELKQIEKFAELIVKECAKIVDQYISDCGEIGILPDYVLNEPFGIK